MHGWAGKILKVDLTNRNATEEPTIPKYQRFTGGVGIGFKVMWDDVPPEVGAFDPENRIVFATGPLVGSEAPGATRIAVISKSPQVYEHSVPEKSLTTSSLMGGPLGPELKFAGYDAVVIHGKSADPVYLWIHDGQAEIRDASKLWGLDAYDTPRMIREELQDGYVQVAATGPAGENLVRAACVVSRGRGDHAAAQGGFGAVMGSKKLKAIAVRGTRGIAAMSLAKPEEFRDIVKEALHLLTPLACNPNSMFWNPGVDPHAASQFGHWQKVDIGKFMSPELKIHHIGRTGDCPLLCYDQYDVPGIGRGAVMCSKYNAGILGVGSVDGFRAKDFGDRYCINVMDLHLMIPWLRSLYRKGVLTEEETGIPFSADPGEQFVRTLFNKIAFREGFGDTLAEGTVRAAKKMGIYDALCKEELAEFLALAEAQAAAIEAQRCCIKDALTTCAWSWPMYVSPYEKRTPAFIGDTSLESRLFSAATGIDTTEEDLNRAGERIHNLMRAVMVREMDTRDMRHDHDVLPDHFFDNPSPSTKAPPVDREKFDGLMGIYYELKGWDQDGLPTRLKLEEMDLKDVADELEKHNLLGK